MGLLTFDIIISTLPTNLSKHNKHILNSSHLVTKENHLVALAVDALHEFIRNVKMAIAVFK